MVPKRFIEGGVSKIKLCHLDLRARPLFDGRNVTISTVPFGADIVGRGEARAWIPGERFAPIPGGYVIRISALSDAAATKCIRSIREVCRGVYVIEYIVPTTRNTTPEGKVNDCEEGQGMMMHFFEVSATTRNSVPTRIGHCCAEMP